MQLRLSSRDVSSFATSMMLQPQSDSSITTFIYPMTRRKALPGGSRFFRPGTELPTFNPAQCLASIYIFLPTLQLLVLGAFLATIGFLSHVKLFITFQGTLPNMRSLTSTFGNFGAAPAYSRSCQHLSRSSFSFAGPTISGSSSYSRRRAVSYTTRRLEDLDSSVYTYLRLHQPYHLHSRTVHAL